MLPSMDLVYVFIVEDADADGWSAEVAVAAANPADASRRIRTAGLHKKQIHNDGRPVRVQDLNELPELADSSSGILRRRLDDGGWTTWTPVATGSSLSWRVSGDAVAKGKGSGHR